MATFEFYICPPVYYLQRKTHWAFTLLGEAADNVTETSKKGTPKTVEGKLYNLIIGPKKLPDNQFNYKYRHCLLSCKGNSIMRRQAKNLVTMFCPGFDDGNVSCLTLSALTYLNYVFKQNSQKYLHQLSI